jgi:hypothetical protein
MKSDAAKQFLSRLMERPLGNLWILALANLTYMCAHVGYLLRNGVDADFKVIFATILRFTSGAEVFFPANEPLGTAYNSTLLYLFLSPLTFFPLPTASRIFLTLNLVLVICISWQITSILRIQNLRDKVTCFLFILTILQLSFAYRSTLANGQIALMFIFLQLLYFNLLFKKNHWSTTFSPIILWFLIELKPYLILPWLVYMFFSRRYLKHLVLAFIAGASFQCIYYLVNVSSTFMSYSTLLLKRSDSTFQELDQASLTSLLHVFFHLDKIYSFGFFVLALVIPIIYLIKKLELDEENRFFIILLSAPLLSIYFHRQDSLLASAFLGLLFYRFISDSKGQVSLVFESFIYAALILNLNWGNASLLPAISLLMLMYILLRLTKMRGRKKSLIIIFAFSMQFCQVLIFSHFGWEGSYKLWTVLVFMFQIVLVLVYIYPYFSMKRRNDWLQLPDLDLKIP